MHPPASNSETTLCTACAALDFKKILRDGLPRAKMVPLGTILDITQKSDRCAFCRLVADLIQRRWRLDDFPHTDVQGINCFVYAHSCGTLDPHLDERKQAHRLYIYPSSRPSDITSALITAKAELSLNIQLLEEDSWKVGRSKDVHGRRIKDKVDIHLVKRWIKLCEHAHGEACRNVWWTSNEDLPEFVRMVDVIQMSLVHASRGCRYVALSYVWGGPADDYHTSMANTKARSYRLGIEESALPPTIVDAIQVTRQLGERYLWVDTLCIIQDNREDKAAQISIMDRVYGGASLTIIAASGTSVRDGLAGLRTGSRIPNQHIECVQGLHLSMPLPASEGVFDSTWDTRGWTFQEVILSRRQLYFTKHQIYFTCSRDVWCEDLVAESKTLRFSSHPMSYESRNLFPRTTDLAASLYHRGYQNAVDQYTQRHLTFESDIIDAISALTNAMTRGLEPAGSNPKYAFRFGMWIRHLDLSLLWKPRLNAAQTRRIMTDAEHTRWPSWAWSGWKGAVQYTHGSQMLRGVDTDVQPIPTGSLVTAWNMVDEDGSIIRLDVERVTLCLTVHENPDEPPPEIYVPAKSHPDDLVLDFLPPRGTLIFRTQCAPFQVWKLDHGALADPSKATAHTIFHIIPVDQVAPHYAGRIVLPVSTPSPTTLEFVVLSRSSGFMGLWDENVWGRKSDGLHVMAVQRMGDDPRVSERVGIGFVAESAWMKTRAEERVVLLA